MFEHLFGTHEYNNAIVHHHSTELVVLAIIISLLGCYASLELISRAVSSNFVKNKIMWLTAASLCMGGCAIWAMHFIAMIAFEEGIDIKYDALITLWSLLIAVFVTGLGFFIMAFSDRSWLKIIVTGIIMGLGIAWMHYMGMNAMIMKADMFFQPDLYYLSYAIAIGASIAALWLCFNTKGVWQKYGSALLMTTAVCAMHFTGMQAAVIVPNADKVLDRTAYAFDKLDFSTYIIIAVIITLFIMVVLSLSDIGEREEEN